MTEGFGSEQHLEEHRELTITDGFHKCAIATCNDMIPDGLLMCWSHWRHVPRALKGAVLRTWHAINDPEHSYADPIEGLNSREMMAYRKAREEAIAHVQLGGHV